MSHLSNRILAVFAHPDDETYRAGGTLALLAGRGVSVQVLTATRGQAGSCGNPPLCSYQLKLKDYIALNQWINDIKS